MADDKPVTGELAQELAELEKQQQIIEGSDESPITLIREREVQISGRVLAAKRQADEIVAGAREQAAEVVAAAQAETDAGRGADEIERAITDKTDAQLEAIKKNAETEAQTLERHIREHRDEVVKMIVGAVTGR